MGKAPINFKNRVMSIIAPSKIFSFRKTKSNLNAEHWRDKRRRTSQRNAMRDCSTGGYKTVHKTSKVLKAEKTAFKKQLDKLANDDYNSAERIRSRNLERLVRFDNLRILSTSTVDIEYPVGVNKDDYDCQLQMQAQKIHTARKSATKKRLKRNKKPAFKASLIKENPKLKQSTLQTNKKKPKRRKRFGEKKKKRKLEI
jgi:hypothetical protein